MDQVTAAAQTVSIALVGSGGAGAITAGQLLLQAAGRAGWYGLMTRSVGPQIRGGEAAALIRLARHPIDGHDDRFDYLVALDWRNVERFEAEIPLGPDSLVIADATAGDIPAPIAASGARTAALPFADLAKAIPGARPNIIALGAIAALIGLPEAALAEAVGKALTGKGVPEGAAAAAVRAGAEAAGALAAPHQAADASNDAVNGAANGHDRWSITGNQASAVGALRGGIRFVSMYPITPATDMLEWLAPRFEQVGGHLIQAEDEIAALNMVVGASYAGVPSLTATSGPGLALMTETIGLAVTAEVPVVIVNVMRGGPSTGIPTKSEQVDLNIALYGLHGDAPHVVVAATSVADCLFATQWSVHLAETLQTAAIVLTDQFMAQAKAVIDVPPNLSFATQRLIAEAGTDDYKRYALTETGVSPMALPGVPSLQYTADGLEHNERGTPSSQVDDHQKQLDKRADKLTGFDYGDHWADIEGDGDIAVITWGSSTGPVREALARARADGLQARLIALRLLLPVQPERLAAALEGAGRVLIVEQSHSAQFHSYLRAHYDLPPEVRTLARPGPLSIRPGEICAALADWS
jgi:2-oxoglutarate ferredoxin oxidoreductase subunit alpha